MNIYTALLFCLGMVFLASKGFADNWQNPNLQTHDPRLKENKRKSTQKKKDEQIKSSARPVYTPPFLGAPSANRLVGMAVRGKDHENLWISVLTPDHPGLTCQAQPVLYWYLSRPVGNSFQFIEFVLNSDKSTAPIVRTHLVPSLEGGIQKIRLADYNISLEPDIEYTWSIALVPDPSSRSLDYVSSGKIKFVESDKALQIRLKESSLDQYPSLFAQAGLWYEAMSSIVNQVEKQPKNQSHRKDLAALLEQVGLQKIVISDHIIP